MSICKFFSRVSSVALDPTYVIAQLMKQSCVEHVCPRRLFSYSGHRTNLQSIGRIQYKAGASVIELAQLFALCTGGEGKRRKNILILSFSPLATHGVHWRSKFVFADPWLTCENSCTYGFARTGHTRAPPSFFLDTSLYQGNPQPSSRVRRRMQPHGAAHAASHSEETVYAI